MSVETIRGQLQALADPQQAVNLQRFFKTGPGDYGEGDRFLGLRVPQIRKLVKEFGATPIREIQQLLHSTVHEERLLALLLMVQRFQRGGVVERNSLYHTYLASTRYINNWDLVDASAPHIVGAWLFDKSREPLYQLARSSSLWERRIAIIATFYFIKSGEYADSLQLAEHLLQDPHDLIHKAVGWVLREVGKCDLEAEEVFLRKHYREMPRTMLRYAIERFPEKRRQDYLKGRVESAK
jgi:3-methyladenine DNA glycosylase AlkD